MYQLRFDRRNYDIIIEPMKVCGEKYIEKGEVIRFNDIYFVSDDRKLLREFAKKLKQNWREEILYKLEKIDNVIIKNKYR